MREHNFTLILTADPDEEAVDRLYSEFDDGTLSTISGVPQVHFIARRPRWKQRFAPPSLISVRPALTSHGSRSSRKHWHGRRDREESAEIAAVEVERRRRARGCATFRSQSASRLHRQPGPRRCWRSRAAVTRRLITKLGEHQCTVSRLSEDPRASLTSCSATASVRSAGTRSEPMGKTGRPLPTTA